MKRFATAACVLVALAFPASALAHVEITPDTIAPGGAGLFTITAPVEEEAADDRPAVTVPPQLAIEGIAPAPGFAGEIVRDQTGRATALSWQGGSIPADQIGLFQFSGSVPDSVGDLRMVAVQTFADGSTKTWKDTAVIHVGDESSTRPRPTTSAAASPPSRWCWRSPALAVAPAGLEETTSLTA